ncbi:MAG: cytochrome c oxidase accessory protein CcoG [Candidatus Marinimicrobia bacterium]|jgi:cytochrome c oxidase accessory protein FixG|nr:cytochrome c oxidase accessory protein CcoG [Candidatus Neomarinimicrobiota bacterium]MBT3576761.1 cytochrome c oxidase accessory protein CcoG [Candidatus Neomarinimicrobiota bacterium]MBT3678969.1 cytochrome c oxidase accessory protein CcoG [Candidatus Neomarinimicrobiota bacterium]MBT3950226.1 cytochrome c oxidase accessory protein CcoG [Candidatus Neomarinimicrobiota bacterium]MBT4252160.1 cytochrome c oxidase accessory protein CcoG [Candidatus Neomarinimicrobiota bacterium]
MSQPDRNLTNIDAPSAFRDRIASMDADGKRKWVFPRKPSGRFYNARTWFSYLLLLIMFSGPFITINGRPFLLLNIIERKFIILGMAFWPQDSFIFVLATLTFVVGILLFTVIFGRLFCGWACPQTIFMEMVFRKIEYLIDGNANKQRKLKAQDWNTEKVFKRVLKHGIFWMLSFIIGNTFLAYIIGKDELYQIITSPVSEHAGGFAIMVLFTTIFYYIYAFFREQICTQICPYGRLQSVLLDDKSIVVVYDYIRGEKRGRPKKNSPEDLGDCIDCNQCVEVCPTGIDIRNGTQLECVNCTACIDACDTVMDRVKKPQGLIRYDSFDGIRTGETRGMNFRNIGYSIVLVALVIFFFILLGTRSDVESTILRSYGTMYQEVGNNHFTNLYTIKVLNKTFDDIPIRLELLEPEGTLTMIGSDLKVSGQGKTEGAFFIDLSGDLLDGTEAKIKIAVFSNDRMLETVKTSFMGPRK